MTHQPGDNPLLAALQADAAAVADHLRSVLSRYASAPARLMDAIAYSLLAGGKRIRPALVLESFRACPGPDAAAPSALAAASAIELVHTFSLVHDDLPAMDNDDLRRGRPTNHKVYGEAMAVLAGDAMLSMAFDLLATDASPALSPLLIRELAGAAGPEGMIGGQVLDMDGEHRALTLDELRNLHRRKTGAMLVAACRMGAICASADESRLSAITDYGTHLGLAFQIVDDVLDVTSTPEQLGKATQKDANHGKNTYPALLGLDASRQRAADEVELAVESLAAFGRAADVLRAIAQFVIARKT